MAESVKYQDVLTPIDYLEIDTTEVGYDAEVGISVYVNNNYVETVILSKDSVEKLIKQLQAWVEALNHEGM